MSVTIQNPAEVSVAHGAALRGSIPRAEDREISLASLSALDIFERQQVINFVRIWRNVFVTAFGFLLAVFVASNVFVRSEAARITSEIDSVLGDPSANEYNNLQGDARRFNELVDTISRFRSEGYVLSPFISRMKQLAGSNVIITRINFQSLNSPVLINGTAPDENAAVSFKNRIAEQDQFSDVNLPLSNVFDDGDVVSFTLTMKVKSLNFGE